MGSIWPPSYSGSGGTKDVDYIRCINGRDPQIHKMWCLGSDSITQKIHPTARVEVGSGTVGQFMTNYLDENGRIIPTICQISINGSVKLLSIPDFFINSGLSLIDHLQAPTTTSGWGHTNTSNQNWGVSPGGYYRNDAVACGSTVPARPAYAPRSPENLRAAAHCCPLLYAAYVMTSIVWGVASLCRDIPKFATLTSTR